MSYFRDRGERWGFGRWIETGFPAVKKLSQSGRFALE